MPRIRSFLAVDPGSTIRERAGELQNQLRQRAPGGKWVSPESMHITLIFLGDLDDTELFQVCRAATAVARRHEPWPIACAGVGAFPNERRPKVIWSGLNRGAEQLQTVQGELSERLVEIGCYQCEERDFNPHLTLGRITSDEDQAALAGVFAEFRGIMLGQQTVRELLVMGSELRRSGPEYTVLGRASLGRLTGIS